MKIRAGYEITYDCPQPTPMLILLSVHPSREQDLITPQAITADPPIPITSYIDSMGNHCGRLTAPEGRLTLAADFVIRDSGLPDPVAPDAPQHAIEDLPDDVLVYLLGSRYCDTDKLADRAWALFGEIQPGWARVQAICDFVHDHIAFGYEHASTARTASDGFAERIGVCRDYAHLAITFCRCMNIPARYCTGYLGDIGIPPVDLPMDFSAWFEVWLGGRWYTFDARHNTPRIGRILMATGRDATDVAISTSFGRSSLVQFSVITDEVT
ncbi:MAG: transglutaminase family protein [Chelatococcus sp.]|uniref:transglutaminase-like domain-containing protein n=1 Tax=Chelatococcus sp. TaxID=1953771 RepID=UPI0025BF9234|nr:transglutaminase family protein [Chelatococcus sp.]MBX3539533.1 transglutaminase family protein [Chelatococcus sp.]